MGMMDSDSQCGYWEARYRSGDMPWEKGAASPGLVDFLEGNSELERGTVCVPGCGTGHDVYAWAGAGFQVTGVDIAPSAIRLARERLRTAQRKARIARADFLRNPPLQRFDWVFEHTLFCAIQPTDRPAYLKALLRWLKTGGTYLAVNYLIPDQDGPPFGTTRQELWELFSGDFDLVMEWVPRSSPTRAGRDLMRWWRRRRKTHEKRLARQ